MNQRLIVLLLIFLGLLATLEFLPEIPGMKPSRLAKELPDSLGQWVGQPRQPGEAERQKLANDTEFARMEYFDDLGRLPAVEASIVFSGKNLSQSIHRPEVCLRAQGWTFQHERYFNFSGVLPNDQPLPVKEIICRRPLMQNGDGEKPEPVLTAEGEQAYIWRSIYYTFIGHEQIVSGHYERTFIDIKDRILHGYDQRWAYATFSALLTGKLAEQGFPLGEIESLDEEETQQHVGSFLRKLVPLILSAPGEGVDPSLNGNVDLGL